MGRDHNYVSWRRSQFLGHRILTSEDKTGTLGGGGGGGSFLIPVRGDVHFSMISMAERLDVVGAHQLRSV